MQGHKSQTKSSNIKRNANVRTAKILGELSLDAIPGDRIRPVSGRNYTAARWLRRFEVNAERPARSVSTIFAAKISTPDNSSTPETGSTFHPNEASPS